MKNLFKVVFGMHEDGVIWNVDSITVIASDAEHAIRRVRKRKNYFVRDVQFISTVDKL